MSGVRASEEGGMCVRKPSEHLDVMVLPATLASLTLPPSVDAGAKGPIPEGCGELERLQQQEKQLTGGVPASRTPRRTDALSARERSAATLIAAHVRWHRARCDPAASRASQDAHPVAAAAASSYASACAAASSSATSSITTSAAASASTDASPLAANFLRHSDPLRGAAASSESDGGVKPYGPRHNTDAASSAAASSSTTSAAAALG